MKKFLLACLVAAVAVTGVFAQGIADALNDADQQIAAVGEQFPKGTWIDANYDAAWEFGVNNTLKLYDAKTGDLIYSFGKAQRKNFKVNITDAGLIITFRCDDTRRTYKFTKSLTLSTDIKLEIDADFLNEHYTVNMKMKR